MTELESTTRDDASAEEPHVAAALRQQTATIAEPASAAQSGTRADVAESMTDPVTPAGTHLAHLDFSQLDSYHRGPLAGAARLARMREMAARDAPPPGSARNSAREALDEAWHMIVAEDKTYDPMDPFGEALEAAAKMMSQPWQPVRKEHLEVPKAPDLFDQLFPPQPEVWSPRPDEDRLRRAVAKTIFEMTGEPLINIGRFVTGTLPREELGDVALDTLLAAAAGPAGKGGKAVARRSKNLPMDEASRMARARKQGYADEPFYRGEASGDLPAEFPEGAYFARDKEYAAGFARRGGQAEPREYRLMMGRAFRDRGDLTVEEYGRLVSAAQKTNPRLAADLVDMVKPGEDVKWYMDYARSRPNDILWKGNAGLVRQAIETNDPKWRSIFVRAGFTAIDSGGDVYTLTGKGMRLKEAAFDPARKHDPNLLASILGGALVSPALTDDPNRE